MVSGIPRIEVEFSVDPKAAVKGFDTVDRAVSESEQAAKRYEKELARLDKAQKSGLLSASAFAQKLDAVEKEYIRAAKAAAEFAGGTAKVSSGIDELAAAAARASAAQNVLSGKSKSSANELFSLSDAANSAAAKISQGQQTATIAGGSFGGMGAEIAASAQEAKLFGAEMDSIRAKFNPLFAASKQYEDTLREIAEAEQMGAISAIEASQARDRAAESMLGLTDTSKKTSAALGGVVFNSRMLIPQLSQIGQQYTATGQLGQAIAVQAADIGLAFGVVGTVIGTVAGVALPSLIAAFSDGETEADKVKKAFEDLSNTADTLEGITSRLRTSTADLVEMYGAAATRVREFSLAQAELAASQAERRLADQAAILSDVADAWVAGTDTVRSHRSALSRIQKDFGVTRNQAVALEASLEDLGAAGSFDEQQIALQGVLDTLEELEIPLGQIPEDLNLALQEMITLSNETDRARHLMAQLSAEAANVNVGVPIFDQGLSSLLPPKKIPPPDDDDDNGGGGGGGARRDNVASALISSLQTEREALEAWRVESLEALMMANEEELEVIGGHNEAKERLEQEHQERLRGIRENEMDHVKAAQKRTLSAFKGFLSSLSGQSEGAAKALLAINTALSISQAVQNTSVGATRAIAELGPVLGPPQAAKIKAFGAAEVALIAANGALKIGASGGGGGGSGGGGGGGGAVAAPQTQNILVDLNGASGNQEASLRSLADSINEARRLGLLANIVVSGSR